MCKIRDLPRQSRSASTALRPRFDARPAAARTAIEMSPTRSPAVGRRERQSDRAELSDERRRRATPALGSSQSRRAASGPVITGEAASVSMGGAESGWIRTNEYAMRRRISSGLRAADAAHAERDVPEFLRAPR